MTMLSSNGKILAIRRGDGMDFEYLSYFDNFDVSTGIDTPYIGTAMNMNNPNFSFIKGTDTTRFFKDPVSKLDIRTNQDSGIVPTGLTIDTSKSICVEFLAIASQIAGYIDFSIDLDGNTIGFVYISDASRLWVNDFFNLSSINLFNGTTFDYNQYNQNFFINSQLKYTDWNRFTFYIDVEQNKIFLYVNEILYLSLDIDLNNITNTRLRLAPHSDNISNYSVMSITQLSLKRNLFPYKAEY